MTTPTFDRSKYDDLLSRGLTDGTGTTEKACIMACLNLACGGAATADAYATAATADADAYATAATADAYAYAAAAAAAYQQKYGDETLVLSARIATRILTEMKAAS